MKQASCLELSSAELPSMLAEMQAKGKRLRWVLIDGTPAWIRIAHSKSLRIQMSKGPAGWLLKREARLLREMAARSAPVPAILDEGEGYLLLEHGGPAISDLVETVTDRAERARIMGQVGCALALMHRLGCTQGRPYLRDVVLSPSRGVLFLDFERGARLDAGPAFQARDIAFMVFSIYARWPRDEADLLIDPLVAAYFGAAPSDMRDRTARWCRKWRWLVWLTAPLRWYERRFMSDKTWKEYRALPLALARLGG